MRSRRIFSIVAVAILLSAGLSSGFRLAGAGKKHGAIGLGKTMHGLEEATPARAGKQTTAWAPAASPGERRYVRVAKAAALEREENELVADVAELQLLAQGTGLELNSEEWLSVAAVTREIQTIRQTYEAELADCRQVAPGRFRLEIPVYAEAGDALRARFHAELGAALGTSRASALLAKAGARWEGYFGGFGVSAQTIDVVAVEQHEGRSDFEVTRTVTYWSGVSGGDRVSTRRETHFPAWEDPSGEKWGALLALVGA